MFLELTIFNLNGYKDNVKKSPMNCDKLVKANKLLLNQSSDAMFVRKNMHVITVLFSVV